MKRPLVLLSTQRALLGNITKNMKAITVGFTDTDFVLRVYFHSEPDEAEKMLLDFVLEDVSTDCSHFKTFKKQMLVSDIQANKLENLDVWVFIEYFGYEGIPQ